MAVAVPTCEEETHVDIEFQDLTYTVPDGRHGTKKILRGVSGQFLSGELTAILGPSGAGKSTLLNVLAGYRSGVEVSGSLLSNGRPRDPRRFRRQARYIMQEDALQPHLTAREALRFTAELKLPPGQRDLKRQAVRDIMRMLRLEKAANTPAYLLSGGERKRLSIALELLDNPPVLFLDEPTTGLDDLSSKQCVGLLRSLARGGRTVVCSIHTPSAKLFAMFDHVYVVAEGLCVYRGAVPDLVPFLKAVGLPCPLHYNPADYVIEATSVDNHSENIEKMSSALDTGSPYRWRPPGVPAGGVPVLPPAPSRSETADTANSAVPVTSGITETTTAGSEGNAAPAEAASKETLRKEDGEDDENEQALKFAQSCPVAGMNNYQRFNSSAWTQFTTLVHRHLLQSWRNKHNMLLRIGMYLFMSFTVGMMYLGFGHDGSKTVFNFGFCYCCTIACQFTPMLPVLLNYPEEVKLLKREYFNRWYSFNAYFAAATIARIPALVLLNTIFFIIVYLMSDQPLEPLRAGIFLCICLLIAFTSEGWGLAISSALNMVNAMFVGSASCVPFMLLAVQGVGHGVANLPVLVRIGMYASYMRYGLEGLTLAVYGFGRERLDCPEEEIFCQYRHPSSVLKETGMEGATVWLAFVGLVLSYVSFRAASYLLLRWRLSSYRHAPAIMYVGRLVKRHLGTR